MHRAHYNRTIYRLFSITVFLSMLFIKPYEIEAAPLVAPGDLDPGFGTNGIVTTDFNNDLDAGASAAIQKTDGKIVVVGYTQTTANGEDFALVRYNSDGSLDTSFGTGGKVITTLTGGQDRARAVAIQADSKIVVAGYGGATSSSRDFAVVRYNPDGSLDTSFGDDGIVTTDISSSTDTGVAVAIHSDGKIVVAGSAKPGNYVFALARYNTDGTLDTSFDGDGIATTAFGSNYGFIYDVAIQADDKIVAVGDRGGGSNYDFVVARYDPDGNLDTSFDGDGIVITSFSGYNDVAYAVEVQESDDKVVVAGRGSDYDFFAMARYNPNGSLDTSFDGDGLVTTNFGSGDDAALALALQSDGKIVATGYSEEADSNKNFAVARYNPDGSLDTSFSDDGKLITDLGTTDDFGQSVAIQDDGQIIVAGSSGSGSAMDFAVLRFEGDPPPDTTSPAAITNLAANTGGASGTVDLTWTAPGDDGNTGTASNYFVRYATTAITTEAAWSAATNVSGEPTPSPVGSAESMTVSGLAPGQTYYFAIRARDEVPNTSGLSNSPSAVAGATVSISHIEVIQVTQDMTNTVPLIAGKPTLVRVYVDCVDCSAGTSFPGITCELQGLADSGELPSSPLQPESSVTAHREDWNNQREALEKTLNFILPTEWPTGTILLQAEIQTGSGVEASGLEVTFNQVPPFRIGWIPIKHNNQLPDLTQIPVAHSYLQSLYPLTEVDYFFVPMQSPYEGNQSSGDVLAYLNEIYNWNNIHGWPQPDGRPDQLFGWVDHSTWGVDGGSDMTGDRHVAFGSDTGGQSNYQVYQVTLAHEIGHNLGRRHPFTENLIKFPPGNICDLDDPNWPYDDNSDETYDFAIHDFGFDFGVYWPHWPKPVIDDSTDDFMIGEHCGASVYDFKWISAYTFKKFYQTLSNHQTNSLGSVDGTISISSQQPVLLVKGRVYTDTTAELSTAYQLTANNVISQTAGTDYCLNLEDGNGNPLSSSCFDPSFLDPEWGTPQPYAAFVRVLPYDQSAARLVLVQGTNEIAERVVSANSPTVTLLAPNSGEVINDSTDVTWTANDADGDTLKYAVSYSADSGQSWSLLGKDITDTHFIVNATSLPGSNQALFRVTATDGMNTTTDESDATLTVGRKGPQVYVLSPENGVTISPGVHISLQGYAYDPEDGSLDGSSLSWNSNKDGDLGTGSQVLATLSKGQHVIMLMATDSDNNTTTTTINVSVGLNPVYLPIILKNY